MTCEDIPYHIDYSPLQELRGASLVVLQIPDGLRAYTRCLLERVRRETGARVIVDADPTYGACDLHYPRLHHILGADAIVHVAHTPYPPDLSWPRVEPEGSPRIVYLQARSKAEPPIEAVREAARILRSHGPGRVALTATGQHVHILPGISETLRGEGLDVVIPKGVPPYFEDGQVIGCDYRVARSVEADAHLIVAGGLFHPLGLYLATLKPVVQLDPYRGEAADRTGMFEKVYSARLYKVSRAIDARRWGVVVGLKTGQYRPWLVERLLRLIEERGGEYTLYAAESLNEERMRAIDTPEIDAWIVTSCPRIPLDDLHHYEKPVLTPGEARMALSGSLTPYIFPW